MDETGLQLDFKKHKIVAAKGTKYLHTRISRNCERITITACVNAAGRATACKSKMKDNKIASKDSGSRCL